MFSLTKKFKKKEGRIGGSLQNPRILEVNLVKDEVLVFFDWRKNLSLLFLVLCIAALLVTEIYFGLGWWQAQEEARSQTLQDQAVKTGEEVSALKKKISAPLTYKAKSAAFSQLLNNHVYWTNFFNWLEKNTLSSVHYKDFSGGVDGVYILTATAQSYADVSWQVKAFLNDPITKAVSVVQAESSQKAKDQAGEVSFKINLEVNPAVFRK